MTVITMLTPPSQAGLNSLLVHRQCSPLLLTSGLPSKSLKARRNFACRINAAASNVAAKVRIGCPFHRREQLHASLQGLILQSPLLHFFVF